MASPTSDKLGEITYKRHKCYDLDWAVDPSSCTLVGAPFGGPLAVLSASAGGARTECHIFTSAGALIGSADVAPALPAVSGWTDDEQLVLVSADGSACVYSVLGALLARLTLLPSAGGGGGKKIIDGVVWGTGLVVLADDMQLWTVDDVGAAARAGSTNPCAYRMPTGLSAARPSTSMAVLAPRHTSSGRVEVLLGTTDSSVVVVDRNSHQDQLASAVLSAPVVLMAVAPNGRFLACFTSGGILTVLSTNFETKVLDFDTSTASRPVQMEWCGEDSVVLYWKHFLLMVGPFGHWVRYPFGHALFIVPEADCLRIVTATACELLQRVPAGTEAIRRIGSTDPAAMLYDAMEAFEDGEAKADENLRAIEDPQQLQDAVEACAAAALWEMESGPQKAYLKAAAYGKGLCTAFDARGFVEACRTLRVLHTLRAPEVGLPLTAQQYARLTPDVLVDRLVARHRHHLALQVCEYLGLRDERVVVHWACEHLRSDAAKRLSDDELRGAVETKLGRCPTASFTRVAAAANAAGRRRLATMLLAREPLASEQVKALLAMGEPELALQKATATNDADLVYLVLLRLLKALPAAGPAGQGQQEHFFRLVHTYPAASRLLKEYYRHATGRSGRASLHAFCTWQRSYGEAATLAAAQAYKQGSLEGRCEVLKEARDLFAQSRDLGFHQRCTEDQLELLATQRALEQRFGLSSEEEALADSSVSDTMFELIALAARRPHDAGELMAEAAKLQKKFKIPDRRFWHVRIRALATSGQFDIMRRFASETKPPVGYRPFIKACLAHGQPREAEHYIAKLPANERAAAYLGIKSFKLAYAALTNPKLGPPDRLVVRDLLLALRADPEGESSGLLGPVTELLTRLSER